MGEVVVAAVGDVVRLEDGNGIRFGRVTAYQVSFSSSIVGLIVVPRGQPDATGWPKTAKAVDLTDPPQLKEWLRGPMATCPDCDMVVRTQRALEVHRAARCRSVSRLGLSDVAGVEFDEPLSAGVLVLVAKRAIHSERDTYARVVKLGMCHHGERCYDVRIGDTRVIRDVMEENLTVVDMSDPLQVKRWLRHG